MPIEGTERRDAARPVAKSLGILLLAIALNGGVPTHGLSADRSFDLFAFFDGEARSEGTVDPLVGSRDMFTARFKGRVENGRLRLVETFTFTHGEFDQIWELNRDGASIAGTVRTEDDNGVLSGPVPVSGQLWPDGALLAYDGYAPGGSNTVFAFTHRMTAQPDGTVRNDVTLAKWLLPLARSMVTFFPAGR
ncbi:DUF3833 family protein [Notoacmeibacter marinus]|uniref:DUF3833 family protein n=1 Tax=Notoacmeibacter marinus TaxID=1876515 RepID=UPI000DF33F75|nr:DUF3833 family protein [Notoacmeibacter marinus]